MNIFWVSLWFGDYRVPVFACLNEHLNGSLMVYYAAYKKKAGLEQQKAHVKR